MAASTRTLDRRQRRSRAALEGALVALLADKPYSAITIEELIDRADVVRATFYAHYTDKDALLLAVVDDVLAELTARVEPVAQLPTGSYDGRALLEVVLHALEHPALYAAVLSGAGGSAARGLLVDLLTAAIERTFARSLAALGGSPRVPLHLASRCLVAQLLIVVEDLLRPTPDSTVTVDAAVSVTASMTTLSVRGLAWGLGLEDLQDRTDELAEYARTRSAP